MWSSILERQNSVGTVRVGIEAMSEQISKKDILSSDS